MPENLTPRQTAMVAALQKALVVAEAGELDGLTLVLLHRNREPSRLDGQCICEDAHDNEMALRVQAAAVMVTKEAAVA